MSLVIEARIQTNHSEGYSLTWDFKEGNIGVYGPTGAGKSTLLKHLAGLGHPRAERNSRITVNGKLLTTGPSHNPCVYVSQHPSLVPSLTVTQNLQMVRRHSLWSSRIAWDDVIQLCKLAPLLGKTPAMLSGGELQLVSFARALLSGKPVILLDEPFSALDFASRQYCLRLLMLLRAKYAIHFVFVSHNLQDITLCCGQILAIEDQHIVQFGIIEKVLHDIQQQSAEGYFSRLVLKPGTKAHLWHLEGHPSTLIQAHTLPSTEGETALIALLQAYNVTVHTEPHRALFTNVLSCKLLRVHHEADSTVTLHLLHSKQRLLAQMSLAEFQALNLQSTTINQATSDTIAGGKRYDTPLYAHFASL